jgi:hypothetical protein
VNWQARIAAAVELRRGQNGISATPAATNVHLTIYRTTYRPARDSRAFSRARARDT